MKQIPILVARNYVTSGTHMNSSQRRKAKRADLNDRRNGKIATDASKMHVDRIIFLLWKLKLSNKAYEFFICLTQ